MLICTPVNGAALRLGCSVDSMDVTRPLAEDLVISSD